MEDHFLPECYLDTVLVKTILGRKKVNHQKSCFKVESAIRFIDDFAVGIIDKDKKTISYLDEFDEIVEAGNLKLHRHKSETVHHYFIQLVPAAEKWILDAVGECEIDMAVIGLPSDLETLKKITKHKTVSEDERLVNLCKQLVNSRSGSIQTLSKWLNYLFEKNREANIVELKKLTTG